MAVDVLVTSHHGRGTTGYANSNSAFAVQLIALAGLVALRRSTRTLGLVGVAAGAAALLANGSRGAAATGVIVLASILTAIAVRRAKRRWPAVALSLLACSSAAGILTFLARRSIWPEPVTAALSVARQDMWNVAWGAFRTAGTFGLGPGGYAQINPWAHDSETMSAHSLPMQVAAELGGAGLALLTLMFLCGLAWAFAAHSPQATWIATAAWTALATHAFMDHLLEYWPVALTAGLVLGYALVAEPDTQSQDQAI